MAMRAFTRAALIAPAAAIVLLVGALPAAADTSLSTTGAAGRIAVCPDGGGPTWCLYARDTLSDGHCARWQIDSSGWQWWGGSVCTGTETNVGRVDVGRFRICRTGVGNCSRAAFTG
jgi:hypothetical protein